jgi:hypothetical protein
MHREISGGKLQVEHARFHRIGGMSSFRILWEYSLFWNHFIPFYFSTEHENECEMWNGPLTFHLVTPTEHTFGESFSEYVGVVTTDSAIAAWSL